MGEVESRALSKHEKEAALHFHSDLSFVYNVFSLQKDLLFEAKESGVYSKFTCQFMEKLVKQW